MCVTPARCITVLYSTAAAAVFTWKNESGDTWNLKSSNISVKCVSPNRCMYGAWSAVHRVCGLQHSKDTTLLTYLLPGMCSFILIYGLINSAVSSSGDMVSHSMMICETMEKFWSDFGLIWGSILMSVWRDWEKSWKTYQDNCSTHFYNLFLGNQFYKRNCLNEIMWNANLIQQGNFIDVFLARYVSGTYAHHQEH